MAGCGMAPEIVKLFSLAGMVPEVKALLLYGAAKILTIVAATLLAHPDIIGNLKTRNGRAKYFSL